MLRNIERREELKYKTFDILREVKALLKEREALCEEWEMRVDDADDVIMFYENLIVIHDTPEISKKLIKAYNRERHYSYIYHKIDDECDELSEAIYGLEKAEYWL